MSLYEEDDFNESEIDINSLTTDERSGYLAIPAFAVFTDLAEIGQVEDFDPRWQLTFRLPKGGNIPNREFTYGSLLFAVGALIGEKTWKNESDEKLDAIWGCIESGISPKQSLIPVQDGDLHKPDYNSGNWLIKATRREDEGQPDLFDVKGNPIFDEEGELCEGADVSQVVRPGDYCFVLVRMWAQKKRERLNFSLEGVRLIKRGAGAKALNTAQRKSALKGLAGCALPELPAGTEYEQDEEQEETKAVAKGSSKKAAAKRSPKKAAVKKAAAKKSAGKKKGSVFRKRAK